jgi:hypothetical protein
MGLVTGDAKAARSNHPQEKFLFCLKSVSCHESADKNARIHAIETYGQRAKVRVDLSGLLAWFYW